MIRRLFILLLIVGCATLKEATTYTTAAKFTIGMTEQEFIRQNPSITKENDWQRWEKVINSPESTTYFEYESITTFVFYKVDLCCVLKKKRRFCISKSKFLLYFKQKYTFVF